MSIFRDLVENGEWLRYLLIIPFGLFGIMVAFTLLDSFENSQDRLTNICNIDTPILSCEKLNECYDKCEESSVTYFELTACRGEYMNYIVSKCGGLN